MLEVRVTINKGITLVNFTALSFDSTPTLIRLMVTALSFFAIFILHLSFKGQSKKPYHGLSSTTEDNSDSRSDWTEDADDADDGRSIIGTDP